MRKLRITVFLLFIYMLFVTACGPSGQIIEDVDEKRTQLYVASYDGGVGNEWLDAVKARFEKQYEDIEFEPGTGKKGVQVVMEKSKSIVTSTMADSHYEVYFVENTFYNDLASKGLLLDISDIVTEPLNEYGETHSIQDKLSPSQQKALKSRNNSYYALPHYETFPGVIYDKDVFDVKKLYFADDVENSNKGFILNDNQKRSCGPDGIYGNDDDGLPSSYEEFFMLCNYMDDSGVTPFIWAGKNQEYTNYLMLALYFSYSGTDRAMYNITFDSNGNTLPVVAGFNGQGEPQFDNVAITPQTGYLMSKDAGRYYSLTFLEKLVSKMSSGWTANECINTAISHTDAQETFIRSGLRADIRSIAMIIEGGYWENEAKPALQRSLEIGGTLNRNFRWMPLPALITGRVEEGEGKSITFIDISSSYAFINANISSRPQKEALAKLFLKYCYTDKSLAEFTELSGVSKGVSYGLPDESYAKLTNFQKNIWNLREAGSVVHPISANPIYVNFQSNFSFRANLNFWESTVTGNTYIIPFLAMRGSRTARQYFEGMNVSQSIWQSKYSQYYN